MNHCFFYGYRARNCSKKYVLSISEAINKSDVLNQKGVAKVVLITTF